MRLVTKPVLSVFALAAPRQKLALAWLWNAAALPGTWFDILLRRRFELAD